MSTEDKILYSYVALRPLSEWRPEQGCPAWVENRGQTCNKTPTHGYLCARHHGIALKRMTKEHEQGLERWQAATERREWVLPRWREELEGVETLIRRLDPDPQTRDLAAYGGAMHPSVRRRQQSALSGSKVQRMAELHRRAEDLRRKIGDDR